MLYTETKAVEELLQSSLLPPEDVAFMLPSIDLLDELKQFEEIPEGLLNAIRLRVDNKIGNLRRLR